MPEITLRDHFAGLAMQAWLNSNAPCISEGCDACRWKDEHKTAMAVMAYEKADAMLEARGQQKTCEWTWQTHKEIRTSCGHLYPGLIRGFECPHCQGRIVVKEADELNG